nr:MAG TPA: hypothetical protein [Caudoviricetes sp.]
MLLITSAKLYFQRSLFLIMPFGCLKYFKIFILISL